MSDENKNRKNRYKPLDSNNNKITNKEEEYIDIGSEDLNKEEEKLPYVPYRDEKNSLFEGEITNKTDNKSEPEEEYNVNLEEEDFSDNLEGFIVDEENNEEYNGSDSFKEEDTYNVDNNHDDSPDSLEEGDLEISFDNSSEENSEHKDDNPIDYLKADREQYQVEEFTSDIETESEETDDSHALDLSEGNGDYLDLSNEEELRELNLTVDKDSDTNEEHLEDVKEIDKKNSKKKVNPKFIIAIAAGGISLLIIILIIFNPFKDGFNFFNGLLNDDDYDSTVPIEPDFEEFEPNIDVVEDIDENEERVTEETEELKGNLKPMFEGLNSYVDKVSQTKNTIIIEGTVNKVKDTKDPEYEIIRLARWSQIPAYEFLVDELTVVQVKLKYKSKEYLFETEKPIIEFIAKLNYEDRHSSQLWWDKTRTLENGTNMKKDLVKDRLYVEYPHPRYYEKSEPAEQEDNNDKEGNENTPKEIVILGSGNFVVGEGDIEAGRYTVRTDERSGNLFIDQGTFNSINEILGTGPNSVNSVTVTLKDGDEITIKGLNKVEFIPYGLEIKEDSDVNSKVEVKVGELTNLGSGEFTVGEDIKPGRYLVSTEEPQGNLIINEGLKTNEILGVDFVNNVTVNLESGDKVEISNLNEVVFTPKTN